MLDRFVSFEGAFNVRDLGGLQSSDGAVRRGLLYRAASPRRLTDADRATVADMGVHHVLDLRTGDEADMGTWAVAPHMTRHNFAVIDVMPDPLNPPPDLKLTVDRVDLDGPRVQARWTCTSPAFEAREESPGAPTTSSSLPSWSKSAAASANPQ